jgi:hypothetical protein
MTDGQMSKILPIVVERRQRIQEVRTESTLSPRQRKKQVESILEDSDKSINALLTPNSRKPTPTWNRK